MTLVTCPGPRASLKPQHLILLRSCVMIAILVIGVFLAVIIGLNLVEFGRAD